VLVQDALFLIPRSKWLGTGLDSFMKFSCIRLTEVHNSVLQAAVEFGWFGGTLLLTVILAALGALFPLARHDDAARFVLCSLAFVALLTLAHGRVSRDGPLFALLGCAVGLRETSRAPAPAAVVT
jgi:O-antigen ligase